MRLESPAHRGILGARHPAQGRDPCTSQPPTQILLLTLRPWAHPPPLQSGLPGGAGPGWEGAAGAHNSSPRPGSCAQHRAVESATLGLCTTANQEASPAALPPQAWTAAPALPLGFQPMPPAPLDADSDAHHAISLLPCPPSTPRSHSSQSWPHANRMQRELGQTERSFKIIDRPVTCIGKRTRQGQPLPSHECFPHIPSSLRALRPGRWGIRRVPAPPQTREPEALRGRPGRESFVKPFRLF